MRIAHRHREGFALAVALGAIVVIGTLIAGAFWTSMQHYRSTRNSLAHERALNSAEFGQNWVLANWNSAAANALALGNSLDYTPAVPGGLGTVDVRMTRLNQTTYWVVSEGRSGEGEGALLEARARTNLILRLDSPNMFIKGAVTAAGIVGASGNTSIIGNDANPPGWSNCPAAGPAKPSVVSDNAAEVVTTGGCSGQSCLITTVSPKVNTDPKAGLASTYTDFGGMSYATLTTMATVLYPSKVFNPGATWSINQGQVFPSVSGSPATCNTGAVTNWGEPYRTGTPGVVPQCMGYFPIVWIRGATTTTTMSGTARGQGILLVEGNLSMQGQAEWNGIILVRGVFALAGTGPGGTTGAKVTGAVMLASPTASSTIAGNSIMQYSSCAINEVLGQLNPPPIPVAVRSWGDMF